MDDSVCGRTQSMGRSLYIGIEELKFVVHMPNYSQVTTTEAVRHWFPCFRKSLFTHPRYAYNFS
jgi:hypothetical protein